MPFSTPFHKQLDPDKQAGQISTSQDADRHMGQPHHGHRDADFEAQVDEAELAAGVYEPDRAAFAKYYGLNVNPLSYDFDFVGYGRNIHLNPLTGNALSWCELYLPDDSAKQGRAYLVDNGSWATVQDEIDAYGLTIKPAKP